MNRFKCLNIFFNVTSIPNSGYVKTVVLGEEYPWASQCKSGSDFMLWAAKLPRVCHSKTQAYPQ
jgi:hypothetical protein